MLAKLIPDRDLTAIIRGFVPSFRASPVAGPSSVPLSPSSSLPPSRLSLSLVISFPYYINPFLRVLLVYLVPSARYPCRGQAATQRARGGLNDKKPGEDRDKQQLR